MTNYWGGAREGAGRPPDPSTRPLGLTFDYEVSELLWALGSGANVHTFADGREGEWTDDELRSSFEGWARDYVGWQNGHRGWQGSWAHFRFVEGLSAEEAREARREAWLAAE